MLLKKVADTAFFSFAPFFKVVFVCVKYTSRLGYISYRNVYLKMTLALEESSQCPNFKGLSPGEHRWFLHFLLTSSQGPRLLHLLLVSLDKDIS